MLNYQPRAGTRAALIRLRFLQAKMVMCDEK